MIKDILYTYIISRKWEIMIGWRCQVVLEKKNDCWRKWDDVRVERKHILESEYANVKHRGLIYIGKFRQIFYPGVARNFAATVYTNVIKLVPQKVQFQWRDR